MKALWQSNQSEGLGERESWLGVQTGSEHGVQPVLIQISILWFRKWLLSETMNFPWCFSVQVTLKIPLSRCGFIILDHPSSQVWLDIPWGPLISKSFLHAGDACDPAYLTRVQRTSVTRLQMHCELHSLNQLPRRKRCSELLSTIISMQLQPKWPTDADFGWKSIKLHFSYLKF